MARKKTAAPAAEVGLLDREPEPAQPSRPHCVVCSAKAGKPVYMKRAVTRDQSDVYRCVTPGCRFSREIPAVFETPTMICPLKHDDDAPRVCVEAPSNSKLWRKWKMLKCPDPRCKYSTNIPLRRVEPVE